MSDERRTHIPAGRALMSAERLVNLFRANVDLFVLTAGGAPMNAPVARGTPGSEPACRCYRCGILLTRQTVHVDRFGIDAENVRPACGVCYG